MSSTEDESRPTRSRKSAEGRPTRRKSEGEGSSSRRRPPERDQERDQAKNEGRDKGKGSMSATQVARAAAEVLSLLTGRTPESVTGIERRDDGWRVRLEVVETHRVPETNDLMALYDVDLDGSGEFTGHRRVRRYSRGQGGED